MSTNPEESKRTETAPHHAEPDVAATRDAYQEKLDARLDQWQAKLDELKAKSRELKADASIEAQSALDEAKQRFASFQQKAENFKDSSKEAWHDLVEGCEESWNVFKGAATKATQHY